MKTNNPFNPNLDLTFERVVDVPRALVWRAWTEPDLLKQWFTPAPWQTIACEIDLRVGGILRTVFESPEGERFTNTGCYLDIVTQEKAVGTNAMQPGFRPSFSSNETHADFPFTAIINLATQGTGTKYTATVLHADTSACKKHAAMGFHDGWGKALDQLVALTQRM